MRLRMIAIAAGLAALSAPAGAANPPDPGGCARAEAPEGGERERSKPLPVPRILRELLASSLHHYALTTLGGARICVDTSWIEITEDVALSRDGRFLSFAWQGYEAYGYKLVDRVGRGKLIEIGAAPVFSPSRSLIAAIDQSESEFGSLSGLAIWRVTPADVVQAAEFDNLPRMDGWRIDGWAGDDCLNLSANPPDGRPEDKFYGTPVSRARFVARPIGRTWRVEPATASNRCLVR